MVKHSIFETNLNNHLIWKWNDFEWFKMGLAMQLSIINVGYTEYLPFKGEALAPGQIIQPLLHRKDSRGFYFFPPASLWFLTT